MNVLTMPKKSEKEISLGELTAEINKRHRLLEESARTTLQHAIEVGILLIRAKPQVGHGNWTTWIAASCPFQERMAQIYMQIAERREELAKAKSISDIAGAIKQLQQSNRPNKNRNNKDTLPKETGKLAAAASKSCLETKHLIERIDEREGKGFWAKDDPAVARVAKRGKELMSALIERFGERD